MRFDEFVHWSDGLFLQPHHMQEMQRSLVNFIRGWRGAHIPYCYGFADLELDTEALDNGRVVIKRFSVIMPDGREVSVPGNASISPLVVPVPKNASADLITVYLTVPLWSEHEANISGDGSGKRLYSVREVSVRDENTGDNEITLLRRFINARLAVSEDKLADCSALPVLKLACISRNAAEPKFVLNDYMPPFLFVTGDCPLAPLITELTFQLRRRRDKIISDMAEKGFNPENLSGSNMYAVLQLRTINRYEARLDALVSSERASPFTFYMELRSLLGELAALQPLSKRENVSPYKHSDAMPVFREIIANIRSLIMPDGYAGYTRIDFIPDSDGLFYEAFLGEAAGGDKEYYIAVLTSAPAADTARAVEAGDNFKLIDPLSKNERIRGVKLEEMRYPPRFLPVISNALWFRICAEESRVVWKNITGEKCMVIDFSAAMFPDFRASLFVTSVISEVDSDE